MENKDVRKELNELSPLLSKLREQSGGKDSKSVPEDYFKNIRGKLIAEAMSEEVNLQADAEEKNAKQRTLVIPKWVFGIAASFTLLMAVWWSFDLTMDKGGSTEFALNDLSYEELAAYVDDNLESFEENDLYTLVQDGDLGDFDLLDSNADELEVDYLEEEILEEFNYDELL